MYDKASVMRSQHRIRSLAILFIVGLLLLPIGVSAGQAKNVILMIGDGMGPSQFGAAWLYSNRVLGKELRMVEVMRSGRTAYLVNDTADTMVTDAVRPNSSSRSRSATRTGLAPSLARPFWSRLMK